MKEFLKSSPVLEVLIFEVSVVLVNLQCLLIFVAKKVVCAR